MLLFWSSDVSNFTLSGQLLINLKALVLSQLTKACYCKVKYTLLEIKSTSGGNMSWYDFANEGLSIKADFSLTSAVSHI